MRVRQRFNDAVGPAYGEFARDLTADGLTSPDFVADLRDAGPGVIVALIPAHNEEDTVGEALESLAAQTRLADRVIVVADRCDDSTIAIALAHGAEVIPTVDNRDKKAGAVNQVLDQILPRLTRNDAVLMLDADTSLSPGFLSAAATRLREPEGDGARVGGVGGIFFGCYPVRGLVGRLQDNEYIRYARDIARRKGRADVLTGTATLFSVRALNDVLRARAEGVLPSYGGVYGLDAITEDNELTLALKHLGYRAVSPAECTVGTRLPDTVRALFYQRLRWQHGALENLVSYGLTRHTVPYVARQVMTYLGVAFVPFYLTVLIVTLLTGTITLLWFWTVVAIFFIVERAWAVKRGGWRSVALSIAVLPEIVFDLFLHSVYLRAAVDVATGTPPNWAYVRPAGHSHRRWLRRLWSRVADTFLAALCVAAVIAIALGCMAVGIAWHVIAVLVLAGTARAALRLTGLDPMGLVRLTGENGERSALPERHPQGFGGGDVDR